MYQCTGSFRHLKHPNESSLCFKTQQQIDADIQFSQSWKRINTESQTRSRNKTAILSTHMNTVLFCINALYWSERFVLEGKLYRKKKKKACVKHVSVCATSVSPLVCFVTFVLNALLSFVHLLSLPANTHFRRRFDAWSRAHTNFHITSFCPE